MLSLSESKGKWALVVMVLGSSMAFLDGTVVNVALHTIKDNLHTGISGTQWTVDAYLLTLGSLIVLGGSLGDMYGRRRVFVVGVIAFALSSLLCGIAPSLLILVLARAVQGIAGALLVPASLAIINATFEPGQRGRAIGAWSGATSAFIAVGPMVGGLLVAVSWRLVFLINLPLAALTVFWCLRHVPESGGDTRGQRPDFLGALAISIGLGGVVYALIEGPAHGWNGFNIALGVVGSIALVGFVIIERSVSQPMVPLSIFRSLQFSGANLATVMVYSCLGVTVYLLVLFLQDELNYLPIAAALAFFPGTVFMFTLSSRMGALTTKYGPQLFMTVGPLIIAGALVWIARLDDGANYFTGVLPPAMLFGIGLVITVAPLTTAVMTSVPQEHSGVGSAVNNAVSRIGTLLAVAAVPAVTGYAASAGPHTAGYIKSFHAAMLLSAGLAALGGIVSLAMIRKPAIPATAVATT